MIKQINKVLVNVHALNHALSLPHWCATKQTLGKICPVCLSDWEACTVSCGSVLVSRVLMWQVDPCGSVLVSRVLVWRVLMWQMYSFNSVPVSCGSVLMWHMYWCDMYSCDSVPSRVTMQRLIVSRSDLLGRYPHLTSWKRNGPRYYQGHETIWNLNTTALWQIARLTWSLDIVCLVLLLLQDMTEEAGIWDTVSRCYCHPFMLQFVHANGMWYASVLRNDTTCLFHESDTMILLCR